MERRDLMRAILLATGVSFTAHAVTAAPPPKTPAAIERAQPQGFIKSGNPNAAGGPSNPGKGNPFNAY
jgi:hypothetical protein